MKRKTVKRIFFKTVLLHVVIYLMLTRQHFWDVYYYWTNTVFVLSYIGMWLMCIFYMLWVNLCYCIFLVFQPGGISKLSLRLRERLAFYLSFGFIALMHLLMVILLFAIAGDYSALGDYVLRDYPFFIAALSVYVLFVYRKPERSLIYNLMWNTFRGGIRVLMDILDKRASVEVGYTTMTIPMSEEGIAPAHHQAGDNLREVLFFNIVLFYFSKQRGSYLLTTSGQKIFIPHTSRILQGIAAESWFVKINKNVYVNMWYFATAPTRGQLTIDSVLWKSMSRHLTAEDIKVVTTLIHVSKRCKPNVAQHFKNRDCLETACWDEVMYY